jgi:4-diphosphocytidyl-2C-methyl-D-erythritol kinase
VISAQAPGKINLFFQVGPVQENGYHNVVSLYQAVDLFETVSVEPASDWDIEVTDNSVDAAKVPLDETNIVIQAAKALASYVGIENPQPMRFVINKQIPVAGGMAGGSADAAAALIALNEIWCLGLEVDQLMVVGSKVGADVPFAILGGTALGTSSGAKLQKVDLEIDLYIVLILNPDSLSTKVVFERFDELELGEELTTASPSDLLGKIGFNSLQPAAVSLLPSLEELSTKDFGVPGPHLSGSGPTMWCHTPNESAALAAAEKIQALGYKAIVTKTTSKSGALI